MTGNGLRQKMLGVFRSKRFFLLRQKAKNILRPIYKELKRLAKSLSRGYKKTVVILYRRLPKPVRKLIIKIYRQYRGLKFKLLKSWKRLPGYTRLSFGAIGLFIVFLIGLQLYQASWYGLSHSRQQLLTKSIAKPSELKESKNSFSFNLSDQRKGGQPGQYVLASSALDSTGAAPYQVTLNKDPAKGITFADSENKFSFTITPQFKSLSGKPDEGRVVYPLNGNSSQVYTLKRNGIKEDIILNSAPRSGQSSFSWKLNTGDKLEARLIGDGSVGIYAGDSLVNSEIKVGDTKSQKLLDNARKNGAKTELKFVLPKPFLVDSKGNKRFEGLSFSLKNNVLTLNVSGLRSTKTKALKYPISIDPSVVVTTTSDFRLGFDDGSIDYSTSNQIKRSSLTQGVTTWTTTSALNDTYYNSAGIAYNGYIYLVSGSDSGGNSNAVQYAVINANGTVGTWHYTHNSTDDGTSFVAGFINTRQSFSAVAYSGYMYIMGGQSGGGALNDVQFAPINSDGTVGTWHYTHNSTDDGVSFVAGFDTGRSDFTSVAYSGNLYILGGQIGSAGSTCKNTGSSDVCSDVQVAAINSNGTIGSWSNTSYFTTARTRHSTIVYNGFIYVSGGCSSTANYCAGYLNNTQYAPIYTDGTLGTWSSTTNLPTAPDEHAMVAYNGYVYLVGGCTADDASNCNTFLNNVWYAPLKTDGTIGTWISTTAFTTARSKHASVVYRGNLYVIGGAQVNYGGPYSDVQYAPINANGALVTNTYGTAGTWDYTNRSVDNGSTYVAGFTTTPRQGHSSLANNGYLYVIGGYDGTAEQSDIQFAPINANGTIGNWDSASSFDTPRDSHSSVIYNGYMYVLGGYDGSTRRNDVQYAAISSDGTLGSWNYTSSFVNARQDQTAVAYNGYMYVLGGYDGSTYYNDVQYAVINSNGTLGSWNYTHASGNDGGSFVAGFYIARSSQTSAAYNGYIYVAGGVHATSDTLCNGSASVYCSDVQYAPINSDGTIGTWNFTHGSASDGGTFSAGFTNPRQDHSTIVQNGFLYVIGGYDGSTYYSDTQYAAVNSNGTIGTWSSTSSFITARTASAVSAYSGFIYLTGGFDGTNYYDDVQYSLLNTLVNRGHYEIDIDTSASNTVITDVTVNGQAVCGITLSYAVASIVPAIPSTLQSTIYAMGSTLQINANNSHFIRLIFTFEDQICGKQSNITDITVNYNYLAPGAPTIISPAEGPTVNTWVTTSSFSTARFDHSSVAYNGYLYIMGGCSGAPCGSATRNDVQYAKINIDGTLDTWKTTTSFTSAREGLESIAYNGYLYILGGTTTAPGYNDAQYAYINADGSVGTWYITTLLPTARSNFGIYAHNGYMYIAGGFRGSSSTACNPIAAIGCSDVFSAPINANGALGAWTATTSLPAVRYSFGSPINNGYIYAVGGHAGGVTNTVLYALICTGSNSGSGGCGSTPGTIGTWNTATTSFTTARYYLSSFVFNGYLYVTGGYDLTNRYNDVQYALICTASNSGVDGCSGTVGDVGTTWHTTTTFTTARYGLTAVTYNGFLYVAGGCSVGTCSTFKNDVQEVQFAATTLPVFQTFGSQVQNSYLQYKIELCTDINCQNILRKFDETTSQTNWSGQDQQSTTAYAGSIYPEMSTIASIAYTSPALTPGTTYYWRAYVIDPAYSNTWSAPARVAVFRTDFTASVPALLSPANGTINVPTLPIFQLAASDPTSDYLRYKIQVCSVSDCSVVVRTIDETSSQTGWQGMSTQSGTAYTSNPLIGLSQVAIHQYQATALSPSTQYWWRGYSIDPGGANTFSAASTISTFTTGSLDNVKIQGGTTIYGGTNL